MTTHKKLNANAMAALKPGTGSDGRSVVHDQIVPELTIRTGNRRKTFLVQTKRFGRFILGHYSRDADPPPLTAVDPPITVEQARDRALWALDHMAAGRDPRVERQKLLDDERRTGDALKRNTVAAAVEAFLTHERTRGLRTSSESTLRREFLGQTRVTVKNEVVGADGAKKIVRSKEWRDGPSSIWRDRPLVEITKRDVAARLDEIVARPTARRENGRHPARGALAAIRVVFNWLAAGDRFGVTSSPVVTIKTSDATALSKTDLVRDRVLSDAELKDVWCAALALGGAAGDAVRVLMITGQRLGDVREMRWSEIDADKKLLTIPATRFKTKVPHTVPLAACALEIVEGRSRTVGGFVFTADGETAVAIGSKVKAKLDARIAARRTEAGEAPMPGWCFHDLRRTMDTRLGTDLDVEENVAERMLGHAIQGVRRHYDHGDYQRRKRLGFEAWADLLATIVGAKPPKPDKGKAKKPAPRVKKGNVVALDAHRRRA